MSSANITDRTLTAWSGAHGANIRLYGRLAFFLLAMLAGLDFVSTESTREGDARFEDFRDATYYPVLAMLEGKNPYNTSNGSEYLNDYPVEQHFAGYVPHHLLLHLPAVFLPQKPAAITGYCVSLVFLLLASDAALRLARVDRPQIWRWPLAIVGLVSWPGGLLFVSGQTTLEAVLGVFLALGKSNLGLQSLGIVLACQKPQFGLPLVLLLLASRRYRVLSAGLGVTLLLVAIVLCRLAPTEGGLVAWFQTAAAGLQAENATIANDLSAGHNSRIDLSASLSRVLGSSPTLRVQWTVLLCVLAVPCYYLWRYPRNVTAPQLASLGVLAMLLATPHHGYDALLLMLPLAVFSLQSTPRWAQILFFFGVALPQFIMALGRDSLLMFIGKSGFSTMHVAITLASGCLLAFLVQWGVVATSNELRQENLSLAGRKNQ